MTAPTTNILTATQLATGTHPVKVNQAKLRESQRVAAVLLRERGLSKAEICRELGVSRDTLWRLLRTGARPDGVAAALEQAIPQRSEPMTITLPWPPSVNHYWLRNRNGSVRVSGDFDNVATAGLR